MNSSISRYVCNRKLVIHHLRKHIWEWEECWSSIGSIINCSMKCQGQKSRNHWLKDWRSKDVLWVKYFVAITFCLNCWDEKLILFILFTWGLLSPSLSLCPPTFIMGMLIKKKLQGISDRILYLIYEDRVDLLHNLCIFILVLLSYCSTIGLNGIPALWILGWP